MTDQPTDKSSFNPSTGLALIITCNRILERAMAAAMTDPAVWDCVEKALLDCLQALKECQAGAGYQPPCPDGTKPVGGVCEAPGI